MEIYISDVYVFYDFFQGMENKMKFTSLNATDFFKKDNAKKLALEGEGHCRSRRLDINTRAGIY